MNDRAEDVGVDVPNDLDEAVELPGDLVTTPLTRDEIRAVLLGKTPLAKTVPIKIFGIDIELIQPTLASIMETREEDDAKTRAADMIIKYAYVPGTDQLIFEDTDREMILRWPFGEDLLALQQAITELTGIDIDAAVEDLRHNPLAE